MMGPCGNPTRNRGSHPTILLNKQGEAVQRIDVQTNGQLSKLTAERVAAVAELERPKRSNPKPR